MPPLKKRVLKGGLPGYVRFFVRPVLPPFMRERQPFACTSTPYFLAAARMRRHAESRSVSLTPSTWSKRAMALRTCPASLSGSLRSFGKANLSEAIRSLDRVPSPCERLVVAMLKTSFRYPGSTHRPQERGEGRPQRTRPSTL